MYPRVTIIPICIIFSNSFLFWERLNQFATSIKTVYIASHYVITWFFFLQNICSFFFPCLTASTESLSFQRAVYDDFKVSSQVTTAILTFRLLKSHRVSANNIQSQAPIMFCLCFWTHATITVSPSLPVQFLPLQWPVELLRTDSPLQ